MSKKNRIEVICPCCQASLKVDPRSGLVLSSREKRSGYSFEDALKKEEDRKAKSDEIFSRALQEEEQRQAGLEDKFKEALESQDELEEPVRPFDLD